MVICLELDADLHVAQLMPLPLTVSCFSKIQIGFTFLVSAHPGSPGQIAVKLVCGPADASASLNPIISSHLNPGWFYLSGTGLPRFSQKRGHLMGASSSIVIGTTTGI